MVIRRAENKDADSLMRLLSQVLEVHHQVRPDIFRPGTSKYTKNELYDILSDDSRPVFVAADEEDCVLGYCFCIMKQEKNDNILTDIKTLYIDDLCVDQGLRSQHIGTALYNHALEYARAEGCYNLTLNVWAHNTSAVKFYERLGLSQQKIGMEKIL